MDLTDEQWDAIKGCFPGRERKRVSEKGGRPWRDPRDVVDGVMWVLRTGARWADLPRRYPPPSTCHRRFQTWVKSKVLEKMLRRLAEDLRDRGKLDLTEAFIEGSHAGAKRGSSGWQNSTRQSDQGHGSGRPLWPSCRRRVKELPKRLIGDRAYDSDPLDAEFAKMGVEMISPHHPRRRRKTQDGRPLRRYRRRWKVERLFAWIFRFRRLVTRYEQKAENFLGLLQFASARILWTRSRDAR